MQLLPCRFATTRATATATHAPLPEQVPVLRARLGQGLGPLSRQNAAPRPCWYRRLRFWRICRWSGRPCALAAFRPADRTWHVAVDPGVGRRVMLGLGLGLACPAVLPHTDADCQDECDEKELRDDAAAVAVHECSVRKGECDSEQAMRLQQCSAERSDRLPTSFQLRCARPDRIPTWPATLSQATSLDFANRYLSAR